MANRTVTGSSLGDGVTVKNAVDPITDVPSSVASDVTITTTPSVTVSGTGGYLGVSLAAGDDTLYAEHMPWANSESSNAFDYIIMGAGNDFVHLDRSAVRNNLNMGDGDDTVILNNAYARNVSLGDGNDLFVYSADSADVTNEELSAKDPNNPMTVNAGNGVDTLNLAGDWTLTLNSGVATLDVGGVTMTASVLSNDQMANVISLPSVLSGTVSFGTITLDDNSTIPSMMHFSNFEAINAVCFTAGTMVETPNGRVPIETLKAGDLVVTRHGVKPLKWIGRRRLDVIDLMANPKLLPVRIPAGAMGNGLPRRDVSVSPQHRVMVRSEIARRMFAETEILVPAKSLVGHNGVDVDGTVREVVYVHIMFDCHTTIDVEGIEAETLYLGREALKMLPADGLQELKEIFGDIEALAEEDELRQSCLPFVKGRQARALVARHVKNNQPFLS